MVYFQVSIRQLNYTSVYVSCNFGNELLENPFLNSQCNIISNALNSYNNNNNNNMIKYGTYNL